MKSTRTVLRNEFLGLADQGTETETGAEATKGAAEKESPWPLLLWLWKIQTKVKGQEVNSDLSRM